MSLFGPARYAIALLVTLTICASTSVGAGAILADRADYPQNPEWSELNVAIRAAWFSDNYFELSRLLEPATPNTEPLIDRHDKAYQILEAVVFTDVVLHPGQEPVAARLADWQRAAPKSAGPDFVRVMYLINLATNQPRKQWAFAEQAGFDPAKSALREAHTILDGLSDAKRNTPYWHMLKLKTAIANAEPFHELYPIVETAKSRTPNYVEPQAYLLMQVITRPAWDARAIDSYVRSISVASDGSIDPTYYTKLYLRAFDQHYHYTFFANSKADWSQLRTGLRRIAQGTNDPILANQRAALACLAGDLEDTRAAFEIIGKRISQSVWKYPRFLEGCREWQR